MDMSDINAILESDPDGGKAESIILLEFEKVHHAANDKNKKQRWKHKSTGRLFWQYCSRNGNSWDSGVWNKQLAVIASGKLEALGNTEAIHRARYILSIRNLG